MASQKNDSTLTTKGSKKVVAKNKVYLRVMIIERIEEQGPNCDLNDIDVSQVTDMSYLFFMMRFNGDISSWDVSNVEDMYSMFRGSDFNGDISKWDVSSVRDMRNMFDNSPLEGKEPSWYKRRAQLNMLMLNPGNL